MIRKLLMLIVFTIITDNLFGKYNTTTTSLCYYGNRDEKIEISNAIEGFMFEQKGEINGNKYHIKLMNFGTTSETEDFIEFKDNKERTITYTIKCSLW